MIKTTLVCDQCGKESRSEIAENWLDVKPAGHYMATYSTAFTSPEVYGLYCSVACFTEKATAAATERSHFFLKWTGVPAQ